MEMLARALAEKLSEGKGPAAVVVPTGGFTAYSREGMFFHEPETDKVFGEALRKALDSTIEVVEVACNINDPPCAEAVVDALQTLQA